MTARPIAQFQPARSFDQFTVGTRIRVPTDTPIVRHGVEDDPVAFAHGDLTGTIIRQQAMTSFGWLLIYVLWDGSDEPSSIVIPPESITAYHLGDDQVDDQQETPA